MGFETSLDPNDFHCMDYKTDIFRFLHRMKKMMTECSLSGQLSLSLNTIFFKKIINLCKLGITENATFA